MAELRIGRQQAAAQLARDFSSRIAIYQNIKEGKNYWHCQFSNQDAYDEMTQAVKEGLYGVWFMILQGRVRRPIDGDLVIVW